MGWGEVLGYLYTNHLVESFEITIKILDRKCNLFGQTTKLSSVLDEFWQ